MYSIFISLSIPFSAPIPHARCLLVLSLSAPLKMQSPLIVLRGAGGTSAVKMEPALCRSPDSSATQSTVEFDLTGLARGLTLLPRVEGTSKKDQLGGDG